MSERLAIFVSFRLGLSDGVSIEAGKWMKALRTLGWRTETVAGEGPVDHLVPALGIGAQRRLDSGLLEDLVGEADVVVVENLCSLPLNPRAWEVVAGVLKGRPAVLHHHDLPWQRPQFIHWPAPPDDPAWLHVVINDLSQRQLADHKIKSTVIRNTFDCDEKPGDRHALRAALGLSDDRLLVLQPTRALPRKNVGAGIELAEALGAVFWLLGPAEDGYEPQLARLFAQARCETIHGWPPQPEHRPFTMADAYAACDVVALPSTWEGFGNPAIESAVHHRPLVIGPYPVASELAAFGFRWFSLDEAHLLASWLAEPDGALLKHNFEVARRHLCVTSLAPQLKKLLDELAAGGGAAQ